MSIELKRIILACRGLDHPANKPLKKGKGIVVFRCNKCKNSIAKRPLERRGKMTCGKCGKGKLLRVVA